MLSVPVLEHIGGHAMAFFELAALHLEREAATGGQEPPDMAEASLAIDAMAALVEGLGEKLGPYKGQLEDALHQLRRAFVRAKLGPVPSQGRRRIPTASQRPRGPGATVNSTATPTGISRVPSAIFVQWNG